DIQVDLSLPQSSAVIEASKETEKLSAAEQIQRQFDNAFMTQTEALIQEELDKLTFKDTKEREKFLTHIIAAAVTTADFERIYSLIWGSQIGALVILNTAPVSGMHPDNLLPIYEGAKKDHPDFYTVTTFDMWLNFLQSQQLITRKESAVHVTLAGREFLK